MGLLGMHFKSIVTIIASITSSSFFAIAALPHYHGKKQHASISQASVFYASTFPFSSGVLK